MAFPETDMANWQANVQRGVAVRQALLVACMAAAYVLVLPWACWQFGLSGVLAATVAGGVCLLASALALWVGHVHRAPNQAFQGVLLALMLRTGIPLGFAVVAHSSAGLLTWSGLVYYLLVFYLVSLAAEVVLSLPATAKLPPTGAN